MIWGLQRAFERMPRALAVTRAREITLRYLIFRDMSTGADEVREPVALQGHCADIAAGATWSEFHFKLEIDRVGKIELVIMIS